MQRIALAMLLLAVAVPATAADPIAIGSRLELLVDRHLIDSTTGSTKLKLHRPKPQEVVLVTDKPWEGNTCAYYTIFRDGDLYRMYYRGSHYADGKPAHAEYACYAESKDGVHWTKPELGLFVHEGSKKNNIVWNGIGTHCFTVFKDTNPACKSDARYKAISRGRPRGKKGLYVFKSPDAIHWSLMASEPVITDGDFDSQNLAFWDAHRKEYRAYHRKSRGGARDIMTETSKDFVNWTKPVFLDYPGAPKEHLYTNAVRPYDRAPHLMIGFPTRYLSGSKVEPVLMTSRDARTFHRWTEPVIPRTAPKDRGSNRSNYMTWGLLQLPGKPNEYSVYGTEAYYTGPDSRVRRFTYRVDGFVSASADTTGGELITKPMTFTGKQLTLNYAAAKGGSVRVEIQDAAGKPIKNFSLADCRTFQGNEVATAVAWKAVSDVSGLAGTPIRLRFVIRNADVYSLRFGKPTE
jgi:hypothetical protein